MFVDTPAPEAGLFTDEPAPEGKSLSGFGQNLWQDVKGTAQGAGNLVKGLVDNPVDTVTNTVKGLPSAVMNEGKRIGIGELLTGHPVNAVEKFGQAAYDKPLTTGLDVLPAAGAAGKMLGIGGKGVAAANLGEEAANLGKSAVEAAPKASALEEIAAGSKTGDPHALFAYTDKFGPGGAERNVYNVFGDPEHPAIKERGWGSSVSKEDLDAAGIPITGKQAGSKFNPIEENSSRETIPPTPEQDPLKAVNDFVTQKYGKAAAQPGWSEKVANYLKNEAADLRGKDIGLMPGQIKSMGPGIQGLEKAEALMDYAGEKGYFRPGLTDVQRKAMIKSTLENSGQQVGAIRELADKRGAPDIAGIKAQVQAQLTKDYGIDAPAEIEKVLAKIDKATPTFSGLSDLATDLNKSKTAMQKMSQHPGPTTDAANIVSRLNNDAIRTKLNPQESDLYTQSLRDFGAHKKLEQAISAAGRKGMAGRGGAVGSLTNRILQNVLDRGGYRMAGNIANRTGKAILSDPSKVKTLPQFFEELAHHAGDELDETLGTGGMAHGGIVPPQLNEFLASKYART